MKNLRGQTLVASLVVIAIICVLLVVFMKGDGTTKQKADGRGKTVLGNAKATAEDSVCKSNISQTRQLFQMQKDSDDEFKPASVADIPGAKSVAFCPVGKEPYLLEIETGAIKCPHPGHGKY